MSSLAFARPAAAPAGIHSLRWGRERSADELSGGSRRLTWEVDVFRPEDMHVERFGRWSEDRPQPDSTWDNETSTAVSEPAGPAAREADRAGESPSLDDSTSGPDAEVVAVESASLPPRRQAEPIDGDPRRDEQLLAAYLNGDRAAFDLLVGRYRQDLYFFLLRFMGDRASAEDAVQETFLRLHQYAGQFDPQRQFRPWLYSIAANWARDVLRTRVRRTTVSLQSPVRGGEGDTCELITLVPADVSSPDRQMETGEICVRVQSVLTAMPKHLRQILHLAYFEQFGYNQIAEVIGIPLGTVKSRLHAAVANFANRWQDRHGPSAGPRRQARSRRRLPRRPPPPAPCAEQLLAIAG